MTTQSAANDLLKDIEVNDLIRKNKMEKEPGEELRSQLGSDIVIDDGNINEFFFMDSDTEK